MRRKGPERARLIQWPDSTIMQGLRGFAPLASMVSTILRHLAGERYVEFKCREQPVPLADQVPAKN